MRAFWLTARIALIFALLLVVTLLATLHLFGRVLGQDMVGELIALRTDQGRLLAEQLGELLDSGHALDDPEVREFVHDRAGELDIQVALLDVDGETLFGSCEGRPCPRARRWARELRDDRASRRVQRLDDRRGGREAARGALQEDPARESRQGSDPSARRRRGGDRRDRWRDASTEGAFEVTVPISSGGVDVATLAMTRPTDDPTISQRTFRWGVLRIGLVGLLGVVGISLYLTRPLRRMSRSMDRVAAGDLDHRVGVRGRDEVARMGRSFNAMADRIQAMIRGQKELMAGVSHELRSPLSRMKLGLELLRNTSADEARVGDLDGEVDALDGMVDELLVASRLDLGSATLRPAPVALDDAIGEGWQRVAVDAAAREMELRVDIGPDAAAVVADRALLGRLLGNLFENAVRHAGRGTVDVTAHSDGGRVRVAVADHGAGVDEEHLTHLFDPFFRADPSRSRRTGGTGLGLMIVRRAVEAHDGSVQARHTVDGGLVVELDLPLA